MNKIVRWFMVWRLKRRADLARKYLQSIEMTLTAMGAKRHERRQFYRDLFKYGEMRDVFFGTGEKVKVK